MSCGVGFVEASTLEHNTAGPVPRVALPVAAPTVGVSDRDWASRWLVARTRSNAACGNERSLIHRVGAGGTWGTSRMSTGEVVLGMWKLLATAACMAAEEPGTYSAHSMKATGLSWCAKWGVRLGSQRLLGYHVKPTELSLVVYNRDAMGTPHRDFSRAIADISSGRFLPMLTDRVASQRGPPTYPRAQEHTPCPAGRPLPKGSPPARRPQAPRSWPVVGSLPHHTWGRSY